MDRGHKAQARLLDVHDAGVVDQLMLGQRLVQAPQKVDEGILNRKLQDQGISTQGLLDHEKLDGSLMEKDVAVADLGDLRQGLEQLAQQVLEDKDGGEFLREGPEDFQELLFAAPFLEEHGVYLKKMDGGGNGEL